MRDDARGITIDKNGNCYVVGGFRGSATFGGTTITAGGISGTSDMFFLKLDANGNFVSVKNAATGDDDQGGYGIFVDDAGNSYISGQTKYDATFGSIAVISKGDLDSFIAKYDPDGNVIWAKGAGSFGIDYARDVVVDSQGNSYLTGAFGGNIDFEGGIGLTSAGGRSDAFIAKYDPDGTIQWARRAGGIGEDVGRGIDLDAEGNVYTTGDFEASAGFEGITLASVGSKDIYIAKYNAMGTLIRARQAGGAGTDYGLDITLDAGGYIFISGFYGSTAATFGCSNISNKGGNDIYIAKYDPAGDVVWARTAGSSGDDRSQAVGLDGTGNAYIAGQIRGQVEFDAQTLNSAGSTDLFVARLFSVPASIALAPVDPVCPGSTVSLAFSASCTIPANEVFKVEISEVNSTTFPATPNVIGSGTSSPIPITAPANPGTYQVRLVSSMGVVSNSIDLDLMPAQSSVALTVNEADPCGGTTVTFKAMPQNGGISPTYQWTVDGVVQDASGATLTLPLPASGPAYDREVTVTMTSSNPCTSPVSDQKTIRVTKFPGITLAPLVNPFCPGSPLSLFLTPGCMDATGVSFTAEVSEVNTGIFGANTFILTDNSSNDPSIPFTGQLPAGLAPGTYKIRAVSSTGLYSNAVDLVITDAAAPGLSLRVDRSEECTRNAAMVRAIYTENVNQPLFQWKVNGENQGNPTREPFFELAPFSLQEQELTLLVGVEMQSGLPCVSPVTAQIPVTLYPLPQITCSFPDTVDAVSKALFTVSAKYGLAPYHFDWNLGTQPGTPHTPGDSVFYTYSTPGTYYVKVKVTDARGCQAFCDQMITVTAPINQPPNVFTPNGDAYNERFTIDYRGSEPFEMLIYNRWGRPVARITDGINGWGGEGNATGVYYYLIQVAGKQLKGWVSLLR